MSLELNFEFKELSDSKSFILKDISAPSFTQTGWSEGSNPAFSTAVDNITVFTITLPNGDEVDLSSQWNSVLDGASDVEDLHLEVTSTMLGLGDTELDDGIYRLNVEYDLSGLGILYGVQISFILLGNIENEVYSKASDISDYYGLEDEASKLYVNNLILASSLIDSAYYAVSTTKFIEAETILKNLSTLLNKFD